MVTCLRSQSKEVTKLRENVHFPSLTLAVDLLVSPHIFLFSEGRDCGYSTPTFIGARQREGWFEAPKQPEPCPMG